MKKYILLFPLLMAFIAGYAFPSMPVSWTFELLDVGNNEVELHCNAVIERGWHLYDTDIDEGGPFPTALNIEEIRGATPKGNFKAIKSVLHKEFDNIFEMEVGYYDDRATFAQRFTVTDRNNFVLSGDIRAQACNDQECTPPIPVDFSFSSADLPALASVPVTDTEKAVEQTMDVIPEKNPVITVNSIPPAPVSSGNIVRTNDTLTLSDGLKEPGFRDLWKPVIQELQVYGAKGDVSDKSYIMIFILGFIGGLVALITPCVWPMIPMTVSFFLKRNKKIKSKAVREALVYGLSIVFIYVSLGLIITAALGPSALNDLATSAVFNLVFFVLLIVFAASFFGAFDLVLPSSWTNKMDSKADSTTGIISIFFMAFTLALVSFSCTGPLIGTLLVQAAASSSLVAPAFGMLGFAIALAIPFVLFAVFPSVLENLPKSGGWLNSVKVVLGFLELALALKFFSVADLAYGWRILDREVFLALWIVIFTLLGIYLLGKIRFSHDTEVKYITVKRLFLAIIPLSFAIYMVPGLWGAPLKTISAFAPPMFTQDFSLYDGEVHAKFDDYEAGMEYARNVNKPVLIDFSGFGCVNCRKMEASVWTDPRVKTILENDYVLITLMVDDKQKLPQIMEVEENGKITRLKTIGDKWSYLQRHKFGTNSQPYYVALDADGTPVGPSYVYDENIERYIEFLKNGLSNFSKQQNQP